MAVCVLGVWVWLIAESNSWTVGVRGVGVGSVRVRSVRVRVGGSVAQTLTYLSTCAPSGA